MPATPAQLYVMPNDLYDYLGSEGSLLRLDDHQQATGQVILVTANAVLGATSLAVTALTAPLLAGDTLAFDGGGMSAVVTVTLSATASVGATTLSTLPLAGAVNALAQATDSGVNVVLAARLAKACYYGTSQVNLYCQTKYDPSQLVKSWSVNRWATSLAARWLGRRRGQSAPKAIEVDAQDAIDEMKMVNMGMLRIEDIGMRTSGWPFITNVSVDKRYTVNQVRVEQSISELTPTQYPQHVDWSSYFLLEW